METFNKAYQRLQGVAGILDELTRPDGILLEPYIPIAIRNFQTGDDNGFRKALRCENFIPADANISCIESFFFKFERKLLFIRSTSRSLP